MRKSHLLAAGVAVLAALMVGGTAQATQRQQATRPAATTLSKVTVRADGASHRLVRLRASGPRLTYVAVCDLVTSTCVNATRSSAGAWMGRLPAQDPNGPYAIGVVGRSASGYVTGHFASDPPPDIPPILNVG